MFTRILVPTDFSAPSDAALAYARIVARRFNATLHLMHVAENVFLRAIVADPRDADAATLRQLDERLTDENRRAGAVPVVERSDEPADAIVSYAKTAGIDLIVMGTHGRSGLAHLLMGSVAEHVLRAAPCPVVTVRDAGAVPEAATFTRILVATDFSSASDAALQHARLLAAQFGSGLHLLHVIEEPVLGGPFGGAPDVYVGPDLAEIRSAQLKAAHERLAQQVTPTDRSRFHATTEVMLGKVADTIARYADVNGFDLVVMGTRGRGGVAHLFMGSVAEHVVRTARCPVLTAHSGPEPARVPVIGTQAALASA